MQTRIRYPLIDLMRSLAVIKMIIFHFFFNLSYFRYVRINFQKDIFWWIWPRVIVFLFMFTAGISLYLVHKDGIQWRKFNKRLLKLVVLASIISLSTFILFRKHWIYFGTLHSIATCSLMAIPFIKYPKLGLPFGLALVIPSTIFKLNIPWIHLGHKSFDYIAPFPWVGVMAMGISFAYYGLHKYKFNLPRPLIFPSKHSLPIYIIHQPLMFGLTYLFYLLSR